MLSGGRRRGLYARVQVQTKNLLVSDRRRKARGYEPTAMLGIEMLESRCKPSII